MSRTKKWLAIAGIGMAVMMLVAIALPVAAASNVAAPVAHGRGWNEGVNGQTYLADALGITAEELQAAQQKAGEAALQQAVAEGLLTQEQADAMQARGLGMMHAQAFGRGMAGNIDGQALLADALGISVADLQAAQQKAENTALDQAVTDGRITQEQADQMKAHAAFRQYLNQDDVQQTLRSAYEAVVQQAVTAGVITQEQADAILSNNHGFGGMHGFGEMRGHGRGFGGMREFRGPAPDSTAPSGIRVRPGVSPSTSGTNL
ncbi:MAG: hypothetical protein KDH86_07865 [Anaerolineae bacterium]|nr:hypothetical protein [Anaerolineae bacterium]